MIEFFVLLHVLRPLSHAGVAMCQLDTPEEVMIFLCLCLLCGCQRVRCGADKERERERERERGVGYHTHAVMKYLHKNCSCV